MSIVLMPRVARKKQIPASIDFAATVGDNILHIRPQAGGHNCTIYWGDGTSSKAPVNGGNVIHSYASAGTYNIQLKGKSFAGFAVTNQEGKEKYVAAYSLGQWAIDTMNSCGDTFRGCINLASIGKDLFRYNTAVTNFGYCFGGCRTLAAIPPDLFQYNTEVKKFAYCFRQCSGLYNIPVDLFRYNTTVVDFGYSFEDCNNLTTLPTELFKYNMEVTNFSYCFGGCKKLTQRSDIFGTDFATRFNGKTINFTQCFNRFTFTGTQGTAPALWSFTGLNATKSACFSGPGNNATSLSNYSSIPAEWKS